MELNNLSVSCIAFILSLSSQIIFTYIFLQFQSVNTSAHLLPVHLFLSTCSSLLTFPPFLHPLYFSLSLRFSLSYSLSPTFSEFSYLYPSSLFLPISILHIIEFLPLSTFSSPHSSILSFCLSMPIFSFPALQSLCVYLCKISIFHTSRRFHLPNLCGSTADLPTKSLE